MTLCQKVTRASELPRNKWNVFGPNPERSARKVRRKETPRTRFTHKLLSGPVEFGIARISFPVVQIGEKLAQIIVVGRFEEVQMSDVSEVRRHFFCGNRNTRLVRHLDPPDLCKGQAADFDHGWRGSYKRLRFHLKAQILLCSPTSSFDLTRINLLSKWKIWAILTCDNYIFRDSQTL